MEVSYSLACSCCTFASIVYHARDNHFFRQSTSISLHSYKVILGYRVSLCRQFDTPYTTVPATNKKIVGVEDGYYS